MIHHCVLAHARAPDRPRRTVAGLLVCEGHRRGLQDDLAELPHLHAQLAGRLLVTATTGGPKVHTSGNHGLTLNDDVARLRHTIARRLSWWTGAVAHHRHLTPPHAGDLGALADWLTRHHDWLLAQACPCPTTCDHPTTVDWADDIRELSRAAWSTLHPAGQRRVDVGPCTRPVACDVTTHAEQTCGGTLRATVHQADDLLPAELVCDQCRWPVPPREWVTAARRLGRSTAWLTGEQLANLWTVPLGTIRYWAHTDQWPRRGHRPTWYDAQAAQTTHDTRRPPTTLAS